MLDQREIWDARYATAEYVFGEQPNAFLASQVRLLQPGMRALAVADGEGRNGVWLAEQGLEVVATDISRHAQAKARRLAETRGVTLDLLLADLASWQWSPAAFDVVVAIFIQFADPALRALIFDGMKLTLKPGGLLLLEGYRPEQIGYGTGGPSVIENLYTVEMLQDAFADFEILHLRAYDADVNEGAGHRGRSALVDLVARKPH